MQGLRQGRSWRCLHHEYRLCRDCEEYHSSFEGADRELTSYKDFLEQQKAYFAEIDAFELSEEEVSSADELE
ncbi:hypothetical protein LINPERPRIM_LOCUS37779 [Linum perenne]